MLLEILMVIALIALLSGVLITGVDRMINPGPASPAQAFWQMTAAARRYALQHECEVRMTTDDSNGEFDLVAHAADGIDLPPVKRCPRAPRSPFLPGV